MTKKNFNSKIQTVTSSTHLIRSLLFDSIFIFYNLQINRKATSKKNNEKMWSSTYEYFIKLKTYLTNITTLNLKDGN